MAAIDVTIIMCAYNEMGRIQRAMDEVLRSLDGHVEAVEIVVLDNGSTDGTRAWLNQFQHPQVRVVLNEQNLGKGGSIKKGIQLSHGEYAVIYDPDLEYRAADIWTALDRARRTGAALVLGSRTLGGQVQYKYLQNYLGVCLLTWLINRLYGCRVTDAATAIKLMSGEMARGLNLECSGFDLDFEIVARVARLGGRIEEIRANYRPRTKGEGKKIRPCDGLMALWAIVRDRFVPRGRLTRAKWTAAGPAMEREGGVA